MDLAQAAQAEAAPLWETLLKLAGLALPVVLSALGLVRSFRRPPLPPADNVRVVKVPRRAVWGPDIDTTGTFPFATLLENPIVIILFGGVYVLYGAIAEVLVFALFGAVIVVYGVGKAFWSWVEKMDRIETDTAQARALVSGDIDDIIRLCEANLRRIRAGVDLIDRDAGVIEASKGKATSRIVITLKEEVPERPRWTLAKRPVRPARYWVDVTINSDTPNRMTLNHNLKDAQRLVEQLAGVRLRVQSSFVPQPKKEPSP